MDLLPLSILLTRASELVGTNNVDWLIGELKDMLEDNNGVVIGGRAFAPPLATLQAFKDRLRESSMTFGQTIAALGGSNTQYGSVFDEIGDAFVMNIKSPCCGRLSRKWATGQGRRRYCMTHMSIFTIY